MPRRVPRWIAFAAIPLVVAAVLVMHGLDADAGASGHHTGAVVAPIPVTHDDPVHSTDGGGCASCTGVQDVLAACAAIVAVATGWHLARRTPGPARSRPARRPREPHVVRRRTRLTRPPEPAWVRLAVMLC